MSVTNNKPLVSILDNQDSNDLKERQQLEEMKRQAKVQQVKLDKKLNKQKIIMGSFLGQVLAGNGPDEKMIQDYFARNFPDFLTRISDKHLFKSMVESLGGDMGLGEEVDPFVPNTRQEGNRNTGINNSESVGEEHVVVEEGISEKSEQENFYTTHDDRQRDLLADEESNFTKEHDFYDQR